jgi:hypothetical protein
VCHRKEVCVLMQNNAMFMTCDRLEANDNQTSRLYKILNDTRKNIGSNKYIDFKSGKKQKTLNF